MTDAEVETVGRALCELVGENVSGVQRPSVSAMFPCYNDARTIGGLVDDVHAALEPITSDLEVIVVNDGSADGVA